MNTTQELTDLRVEMLQPPDGNDPLVEFLAGQGYTDLMMLKEGALCGVLSFIFTTAIVTGMDRWGYAGRYCYETQDEARKALHAWDGEGDPPGQWIIYKGAGGERVGPGAL